MVERFLGKKEAESPILSSGSESKKKQTNMSQDNLIKLKCGSCKRSNYYTNRNKKKVVRKLEFKKFCKWCKKHTPHKEVKITA